MSAEDLPVEWLSGWLDGELGSDESGRVEAALDADPKLRELCAELAMLRSELSELSEPAPESEAASSPTPADWNRIEVGLSRSLRSKTPAPGAPMRLGPRGNAGFAASPFGAWLQAAAVVLGLGLPALLFGRGGAPRVALAAAEQRFRAPPAPRRLRNPRSRPEPGPGDFGVAPGRDEVGVVERLSARLRAGEPVLVTPELGLLLQSGVAARARRVVELECLAPSLAARLRGLDEGLLRLARRRRLPSEPRWRAAWIRARRYVAVPGLLLEGDRGPWLVDEVVASEVALARRGEGELDSEILGRRLVGADFQPETGYRDDPAARRYALAARRLSRSTLELDRDDDLRVACLLAVAAAEVGEAGRWATLESRLDAEYGRRDAPGLHELRRRLAEAWPEGLARLDELEEPGRLAALRERLAADSQARGLGAAAVEESRDGAIPWRILGGVRTREGLVAAARTSAKRPLPSILDLPAALGSEAALELLSIEGEAPTPEARAALAARLARVPESAGWPELARHRLAEVAMSAGDGALDPARADGRRMRLRALLLTIATLQTREPCAPLSGRGDRVGDEVSAPLRVEGPAAWYEGLAWSLRGRARLLGSELEPGRVGEVCAELDRVAKLLESLAEAAAGAGVPGDHARRELQALLPAFRSTARPAGRVLGRADGPQGKVVLRRRVGGWDRRTLEQGGRRFVGFVFRVEERRGPERTGADGDRDIGPVERVWWSSELLSPARGSGGSDEGGR